MNFIYIAPYLPQNFHPFITALADQDIQVLGIGQESYDELTDAMKDAFTEYFRVEDIHDYDEVSRAVAFLFYHHGPIDAIESFKEEYITFEAALREQFHVPGPKPRDVVRTESRAKMVDYFLKAKVPHVTGTKVRTKNQVKRAVRGATFPLWVFSDDRNVHSHQVWEDVKQVEDFLNEWEEDDTYFITAPIQIAEEYIYQGLADENGLVAYEKVLKRVEAGDDGTPKIWEVLPEADEEILTMAHRSLGTFKMKNRFFGIRFVKPVHDHLKALSFDAYPLPDHGIDRLNFTDNADLYHYYATLINGERPARIEPTDQLGIDIERAADFPAVFDIEDVKMRFADELRLVEQTGDGSERFIFVTNNHTKHYEIETILKEKQ